MSLRSKQRGQALVEFTFVGIPMIFVLISIFEISRGMWMYHTMAYAAKEGVRYASVHGYNCTKNGNTCTVNMGPPSDATSVLGVIRRAGAGLDLETTQVTFSVTPIGGTKTPQATCTLADTSCAVATVWPPDPLNRVGVDQLQIEMITTFRSALAMLWPGSAPVSFAVTHFAASSMDSVKW